jgi:hypothetical protein
MKVQVERLKKVCEKITEKDVDPYCRLRAWLFDHSKRKDFEKLFKQYYGLDAGGMTAKWKEEYFRSLFSMDISVIADPYTLVLKELYQYKRIKGDNVLAFSFVSKLVSIHDENRPIYDKHVSAFFGVTPPSTGSNDFRIEGFLRSLRIVREQYTEWSSNQDYVDILIRLREMFPQLVHCQNGRLFDFLVWGVGHYKIN